MDVLLVVDDELSIQKSIERLFIDDETIEVLTASSAKEASALLAKQKVDIIVSDERMPQISGTDFLRYVKEHYPKIQRIILTGYADQEATIRAINNAEVFRFLLKPWEPADLIATVKHALEIKQLQNNNESLNLKVLAQKDQLEKINKSLEETVTERTVQLKKSLELLKKQNAGLKAQQAGIVDLLTSLMSLHDPQKSRLLKLISDKYRNIINLPNTTIEVSEASQVAALLSVIMLDDMDIFFGLLESISGFGDVATILKMTKENFNGTGPLGTKAEAIPIESRLLRIIHDYFTNSVKNAALSRQNLVSQSYKLYDPELVTLVLSTIQEQEINNRLVPVEIEQLQPGMTVGKDVQLVNGALLLPEETCLDEVLIYQLKKVKQFIKGSIEIAINKSGS
jgi:response regulator RpfG family c-di-GMP phosphodiesterase